MDAILPTHSHAAAPFVHMLAVRPIKRLAAPCCASEGALRRAAAIFSGLGRRPNASSWH